MGVNSVPFPRLYFFTIAQAPLCAPGDAKPIGMKMKCNFKKLIKILRALGW